MKYLPILLILLAATPLWGQGTLLPSGHRAHNIMTRWAIKGIATEDLHTEIRPYWRQDLRVDTSATADQFTRGDYWDWMYLRADNNFVSASDSLFGDQPQRIRETGVYPRIPALNYYSLRKPILKYFYRSPAYLFEVDHPFFSFRVNPILDGRLGRDEGSPDLIFHNRRGAEIMGGVDDKVYFYTNILETQSYFPAYVDDRIQATNAIPGAALYKYPRTSRIFGTDRAYDYLVSEGYVGFNATRHVGIQLGHGRNFIGSGYRSLLLSDFGGNYFFLKLNWRVWKFHFQNIFAELSLRSGRDDVGDRLVPKKYMAAHYLSYRVTPRISIGFFETVVFSRNNQFELQYLNPVILYRTVEQLLGSPDNVLIGLNAHWDIFRRVRLYGQLMLDEFVFDELVLNNRKWWANKYGVQAGIRWVDAFGVDHLDLQAEMNLVRPYTYTHRDSSAAYTHYNMPLAHPNGANFRETLFRFRYRPFNRLEILGRVIFNSFGEDLPEENWGSDILTPSSQNRQVNEGSVIGQGVAGNSLLAGLEIRWYFWHNMSLELEYLYRKKTSTLPENDQFTNYIGGGIRMNMPRQYNDF